MALIQRYLAEVSSTTRPIIDRLESFKDKDEEEKLYLRTLNDRLENLIVDCQSIELSNKKLLEELNYLIDHWAFFSDQQRLIKDLNDRTRLLSVEHRRKFIQQAETKLFNEETQLINRVVAVRQSHLDQCELLNDLIVQFQHEYEEIVRRLNFSSTQVKTADDDYRKELEKFRRYLVEWEKISLEKQNLLDQIQTLREHFHLRLALNDEELNEWKRLLMRLELESKNFYRNSFETIKQQIQLDYQQLAKDQQKDFELQMKSQFKQIEIDLKAQSTPISNDQMKRFESRFTEKTKDFQRFQTDYQNFLNENQRKRKILHELQNENRSKLNGNSRLQHETDLIRQEYFNVKNQLDQLVARLRSSVEGELKIYESLLKSARNAPIVEQRRALREINTVKENQKTTTTTKTRRAAKTNNEQQKIKQTTIPELDENYLQSKIHITRKYKGNVIIKFVDVSGRFVEIENSGKQPRDLTGWSIERTVDGRRISYRFPSFQLDGQELVRIYGHSHQHSSFTMSDERFLKLIGNDFPHWGVGREMRTELFNRDGLGKALFEQTIRD